MLISRLPNFRTLFQFGNLTYFISNSLNRKFTGGVVYISADDVTERHPADGRTDRRTVKEDDVEQQCVHPVLP